MSDAPELPDRKVCRTERYGGETIDLFLCRSECPYLCRYALSFGYDFYFCRHGERADMEEKPRQIRGIAPGERIIDLKW